MLIEDVRFLRCIECGGDLSAECHEGEGKKINQGILKCVSCSRKYPIIDEVGVFFHKDILLHYLSKREKACMERMGMRLEPDNKVAKLNKGQKKQFLASRNWEHQWEEVSAFDIDTLNRDPEDLFGSVVFWKFIPIAPEKIKGKVVYVACGGRGREAFHVLKQDPSKLIINEIGVEIYSIPKLMSEYNDKLLLLRCDVCYSPLRKEAADITICDHALQHVLDHKLGFSELVKNTKPGGSINICVYSYENNFIMTKIVEPLKWLLHKFPLSVQRMFAALPAIVIYLVIHIFYLPLSRISKNTAERLPLYEHMMFWAHNSFSTVWLSCFDLIHAPISYHFTEKEIRQMAAENNLKIDKLVNTHKTLWSLAAAKKESLEIQPTMLRRQS